MATTSPIIQVNNLTKTFSEGVDQSGKPIDVRALRGISIAINPGEFIAITGPNGSGKSTLINCLGAIEKPDSSSASPIVYMRDSKWISIWQDPEWYRQNFVGIVFQDFHLLPTLDVDQNVEFALRLRQCQYYSDDRQDRHERVQSVLRDLGIARHSRKQINQISGGERQRVAIARALVKQPRVLLADEPTGNLDQHNKLEILKQLRSLAQGDLAVLMVTHDSELARRFADRVIHMVDGEIVETIDLRGQRSEDPNVSDVSVKDGQGAKDLAKGDCEQLLQASTATPASAGGPEIAPTKVASVQKEPPDALVRRRSGAPTTNRARAKEQPRTPHKWLLRNVFLPGCSLSFSDLALYGLRDARESTVSLLSNVFAIFLGTFLTAMLLALLGGTERYVHHLIRTIPGIDSVHVWVDYSTGDEPITGEELKSLAGWPGARVLVPSINQFVPLFQKPTREVIAGLYSTQNGDPEVARLELAAGVREVAPDGWDIILPMSIAEEINNFNPLGLVGTTLTLQLRRYEKTAKLHEAVPSEVLNYPIRVVGIVKASPQSRAYGSLAMVRAVRDFSTGRSNYLPEPGGRIDSSRISPRTFNESLRVHFGEAAAAERAFLEMKGSGQQRFAMAWPGEKMLYLRDVETVSTIVLLGIGLLAIVAGAVSIFNTLLASVARKTKEIGIMRALGVARPDIFLIFVIQSAIIGIIAGMVAAILSSLLTYPVNAYVSQRWEQLADVMDSIGGLFQLTAPIALSLVLAVFVICLIAAFVPAMHAANKTPMDALRER